MKIGKKNFIVAELSDQSETKTIGKLLMKQMVNLSKDQKILSFGFRLPDFNQGETYHVF
jgi:hypothetical protein